MSWEANGVACSTELREGYYVGRITQHHEARIPSRPLHYHHKSPSNIISILQFRTAGHTIHFSRDGNTDASTVTTQDFTYIFKDMSRGLSVCDLTPIADILIDTFSDNEALHTKRDVTQAQAAR